MKYIFMLVGRQRIEETPENTNSIMDDNQYVQVNYTCEIKKMTKSFQVENIEGQQEISSRLDMKWKCSANKIWAAKKY